MIAIVPVVLGIVDGAPLHQSGVSPLLLRRHRHYYFGDYYGADYSRKGFYPWFEYQKNHRGYDPIYAHERWSRSRTDSHWDEQVRQNYDFRVKHAEARPPRLYSAQAAFATRAPERERKNIRIAAPLSEVVQRRDTPIHFEKINDLQRKSLDGQGKDLAQYRNQRAQWESPGGPANQLKPTQAAPGKPQAPKASPGERPRKPSEVQPIRSSKEPVKVQPNRAPNESLQAPPNRVVKRPGEVQTVRPTGRNKTYPAPQSTEPLKQKIPRSPVAGKSTVGSGQRDTPPSRPEMPKPASNIRPKAEERAKPAPASSRPAGPSDRKEQDKGGKSSKKS